MLLPDFESPARLPVAVLVFAAADFDVVARARFDGTEPIDENELPACIASHSQA
jgi:hypothetical protein